MKIKTQEVFDIIYKKDRKPINLPKTKSTFVIARDWQKKCFEALKNYQHVIINAPPGCGKSRMMDFLSADTIRRNPEFRILITVPQSIIAGEYNEKGIQGLRLPDTNEDFVWESAHNYCSDKPDNGCVNQVIDWLKGPNPTIGDKVCLCCHATLTLVYNRLKAENKLHLLNDLFLWIDEAHHLMSAETEYNTEIQNRLGEVVSHVLRKKNGRTYMGLVTATPYRGDKLPMLTEEQNDMFESFSYPMDDRLNDMYYLESFKWYFHITGPKPVFEIKPLLKETNKKTIIYLPHSTSPNSTNKYKEANWIKDQYHKIFGGKRIDTKSMTIFRKKNGKEFRILDLVHETNRDSKKKYMREHINDKDACDVVITMSMFKEGADWIHAERVIVVGLRKSETDMNQIIGRLFRDVEGKKHVEGVVVFPLNFKKEEDVYEDLTNYLNSLMSSLLMENRFAPVKIRGKISKKAAKIMGGQNVRSGFLEKVFNGNIAKQSEFLNKCVRVLAGSNVKNIKDAYDIILGQVKKAGINTLQDECVREIQAIFNRTNKRACGDDIGEIDYKSLMKVHPCEGILSYVSKVYDVKEMKEFRKVLGGLKTIEEWVMIAEQLAEENNGVLPYKRWLSLNGYPGLVGAINREPESFLHIPQDRKFKTTKEWVEFAEMLAHNNDGLLPRIGWLELNGYAGLKRQLYKYPDAFSHIDREESKLQSKKDNVKIAEILAEQNGGILPSHTELYKRGLHGLNTMLNKFPDLFSHIPQERKKRTKKDNVELAEQLAKEHNGILPNMAWLVKNGYSGLVQAIQLHKNDFKHIQQKRIVISAEEHVKHAELIAKKNNGKLPSPKILREKYSKLYATLCKAPEIFSHIPQEKIRNKK